MHLEPLTFLGLKAEAIHIPRFFDDAVEGGGQDGRTDRGHSLRRVVRLGFEDVGKGRHTQRVWSRCRKVVSIDDNEWKIPRLFGWEFDGLCPFPLRVAEHSQRQLFSGLTARRVQTGWPRERADVQSIRFSR